MTDRVECTLANGFSTWEKIYAQGSFTGIGVFAIVGIALVDWRWVLPYLLIYAYGITGIVMRHLACPRCPHLYVYNDCLQAPSPITKWLVKEQKTTPFSAMEKLLFFSIFLLIPTYPIYWLVAKPLLLVGFLVSAGLWYGGQLFYFCKRCRVEQCPFNRAVFTH
jgi:hypothetical protein